MNKILILLVFLGCTNSNSRSKKEAHTYQITNVNPKSHEKENLISESNESKVIERKLNLIYLTSDNSYKTQVLQTDSFRYQVFVTLKSEQLYDNMYVTIDSINIFAPIKSSIKHSDELAMGGYLTNKESYSFNKLIKFMDVNKDSKDDVLVYNPLVSGAGHNTCYSVFLNQQTKYEYSDEFTKPNLKYNEATKTYSDWIYGGNAGRDYSTRTYINRNGTLIIKHEK